MKKSFRILSILVLLIVVSSYFLPNQAESFLDVYGKKDDLYEAYESLTSKKLKSITVEGVDWGYYSGGNGEKTILLLHGMGGSHAIWWRQIAVLQQQYKVISYTLPEPVDNLADVKEGIEAILEKENVASFYALGTSMGGYITQYLMLHMPYRVEKVILGNTFPPNNLQREKNATKSTTIPLLPEVLVAKLAKKQLKDTIIPAGNNDLVLKATLESIPFSKRQFINRYYVVVDSFALKPERTRSINKLIIEADNDPLVERELREQLKNVYSEAEVYTFKKHGHFPYLNEATTYNQVIMDFLDK